MKLKVKKLHPQAIVPKYQTDGAAAFDLHALDQVVIPGGESVVIPSGLAFEVPPGYELEIRPRSGLSAHSKIRLSNSPGTIDSDYRGEVKFILDNLLTKFPTSYTITKGQRIAQALLKPVTRAELVEVDELDETKRGNAGLGSTGK